MQEEIAFPEGKAIFINLTPASIDIFCRMSKNSLINIHLPPAAWKA